MARVVLAMSGGVDSSVAAHLLQQAGHEVIGVFMRHGEQAAQACAVDGSVSSSPLLPILQGRADHKQGCCSASDAEDARSVASRLGIPFFALDLQREFGEIVEYFIDEYLLGRTPNPCVMCNHRLKFGRLFDYADAVGAEFVATGHYARRSEPTDSNDYPGLLRGLDESKDQSYALFGIPRERFRRMLLPVGDYRKSEIRELAGKVGLNVATKRDSQEICFVTTGHHAQFVRDRRPESSRAGNFVTIDGRVVGQHEGIEAYTIGQRKGLGIALGEPMFVVRIDRQTNDVIIGPKESLARTGLRADRCNWLVAPPAHPFACQAMIRYNSRAAAATAIADSDGNLTVVFDEPCYGVAPGQAVVCYSGERVLGGGWIVESFEQPPSSSVSFAETLQARTEATQ